MRIGMIGDGDLNKSTGRKFREPTKAIYRIPKLKFKKKPMSKHNRAVVIALLKSNNDTYRNDEHD